MSKIVKALNMDTDGQHDFYYDVINSFECPCCGTVQKPHFIHAAFNQKLLYVFCYCESCQHGYIAEYDYSISPDHRIENFIKAYPNDFKYSHFDEYIVNLSPSFVKIYDQALTANSLGLDEIAGMGFRKALEFLVKDYAKSLDIDVSNVSLSDTIDKIDYQPITDIAKPCIKLLNDETHYFRKFEKVEVDNIDKLINAIIGIISAKHLASEIIVPVSDS